MLCSIGSIGERIDWARQLWKPGYICDERRCPEKLTLILEIQIHGILQMVFESKVETIIAKKLRRKLHIMPGLKKIKVLMNTSQR